ncbi:hypothetical protein E2C01_030510 [Portunus trituberculatus]|uniref:Uncharacterized protein n=1 Tax=Portunus trituberculatus TaxID=210409 RepID=A0A5B7EUZ5_PORTR|nr:hypothetical protein [Portunus trituberculatus]
MFCTHVTGVLQAQPRHQRRPYSWPSQCRLLSHLSKNSLTCPPKKQVWNPSLDYWHKWKVIAGMKDFFELPYDETFTCYAFTSQVTSTLDLMVI